MAKILELSTRTASGNTANLRSSGGEFIRCQLNISSVSGTTPTLNLIVEDSVDGGANFNTIASFAQKTAASREVLNVTAPFGEILRVSWIIGGANPSFTFGIDWHIQTRREN